MFDAIELRKILVYCSLQVRKGDAVEEMGDGPVRVVKFDLMPAVEDLERTGLDKEMKLVDCHFINVAVHPERAEENRAAFIEQLNEWPDDQLSGGPSYIAIGAVIGDQGMAFQLMAIGEVLDLWEVITPAKLGITGELADKAAGSGYIMMTGYSKPE